MHSSTKRLMVTAGMAALGAAAVTAIASGGSGPGASSAASASAADPIAASAQVAAPSPKFSNPGRIDNRYLPLGTRKRCTFRGEQTNGTKTTAVLTRLNVTKRFVVDGSPVDAVVIADKAYKNGKHVETALDYYAQADDGTVYYFGEDVKNLKNGKVINTDGSWLYGKQTDALGVAMPANPTVVGMQWRIEDVPGVTGESNRLEETGMRMKAAGRVFTDVIRVQAFIQPDGEVEYMAFASGTGPIAIYAPDGQSELVRCS